MASDFTFHTPTDLFYLTFMNNRRRQAKNWCWTLNNYTEEEEHQIMSIAIAPTTIKYMVFGREVGEQGTPHLQGFTMFTQHKTLATVKRLIGDRIHAEPAMGTPKQAADYCKKDGNFWEAGIPPDDDTGKNQWAEIRALELAGNLEEIKERFTGTYHKYRKTIEYEVALHQQFATFDGDLQQKNFWFWGPPGVGKSQRVRELEEEVFTKNCNKWWDGYQGEPAVILEDLDPTRAEQLVQHLKVWADRYPFTAEIKGGAQRMDPKFKLYITSNYPPEACFRNEVDLQAIRRRFQVVKFTRFGAEEED